jgi:hypothetical protein
MSDMFNDVQRTLREIRKLPQPISGLLVGSNVWAALQRLPSAVNGGKSIYCAPVRHDPMLPPDAAIPCDENWMPLLKEPKP